VVQPSLRGISKARKNSLLYFLSACLPAVTLAQAGFYCQKIFSGGAKIGREGKNRRGKIRSVALTISCAHVTKKGNSPDLILLTLIKKLLIIVVSRL